MTELVAWLISGVAMLTRHWGANLPCLPGGHACGLVMAGHPLNGVTFGVPGTITPLVDTWLDEGQLPAHLRSNERK